jgi:hypothetical protein
MPNAAARSVPLDERPGGFSRIRVTPEGDDPSMDVGADCGKGLALVGARAALPWLGHGEAGPTFGWTIGWMTLELA